MTQWLEERLQHRRELLERFRAVLPRVHEAAEHMAACLHEGHHVYTFGNGGSATQAAHFAAEMVNRFYRERPGLGVAALTTDNASLTAIPNDSGFHYLFSRQLESLGRKGDTALGITTSGTSENVLNALRSAAAQEIFPIALCGARTDALESAGARLIISVPDMDTPAVQEIHLLILHLLAEGIETRLFP